MSEVSKNKTLIVEDDGDNRDALERLLDVLGHETSIARTVAEAEGKLASGDPICLLLDLLLPDGNGITLLRKIRQQHKPVKVAVITGADDPALMSEVSALHPDALFRKPINVADLMRWLRAKV